MATGSSFTIISLIAGWSAILPFPERFLGQDHSINALPFPKRAILSAAAGFFTRSSMIRPTRRGSAIIQSSHFGTAAGGPSKKPIFFRSTRFSGRRLPFKGDPFLVSIWPPFFTVAVLISLLLTTPPPGWG